MSKIGVYDLNMFPCKINTQSPTFRIPKLPSIQPFGPEKRHNLQQKNKNLETPLTKLFQHEKEREERREETRRKKIQEALIQDTKRKERRDITREALTPDYIINKRQHFNQAEQNRKERIQLERQKQAAERKAYRDKLQKEEDVNTAAWAWFGPEPEHKDILQIWQQEPMRDNSPSSPQPEVITLGSPIEQADTKHLCFNFSQVSVKEATLLEEIQAIEAQIQEIEKEEKNQHATMTDKGKKNSPVREPQETRDIQEPIVLIPGVPKCRKCRHKGHNVKQCPRKMKG